MAIDEIVLPFTNPDTEWVLGRAVRKKGGETSHAMLQAALGIALSKWAGDRARALMGCLYRVAPPGEPRRPLSPDVSVVWNDRLRELSDEDYEIPPFAPDVVVEITSRYEPRANIDHKVGVYLSAETQLAIVVDPKARSIELHDRDGVRLLGDRDTLTHPALPGFELDLATFFRAADIRR